MANTPEIVLGDHLQLALTAKERQELDHAKNMPITFDNDCPETTPDQAVKFKRVNPRRSAAQ